MDVEARLLLYAVALGAGVGLFAVAKRRAARILWFHTAVLAALLVASLAAIATPSLQQDFATPLIWLFCALALSPSLFVVGGRRLVRARRFRSGAAVLRIGSWLLGLPIPLRREALLYDALAASERGEPEHCAALMQRLHAQGGLPPASGGGTLARVLPVAGARRWREVLEILDGEPSGATSVLSIEARAAAETGDIRRALRACSRISSRAEGVAALSAARRAILAAGGRAPFLEEAVAQGLPVVAGPAGTGDLALGRAHEARGDTPQARPCFQRAQARGRGAVRRDAAAGLARLDAHAPRRADVDELETDDLLRLEDACREEGRAQRVARGCRPVATWAAAIVTVIVSGYVQVRWGSDVLHLLSVGAVSTPLVVDEGQWWRLFSTMLLHGGWVHLLMNVTAIVPVGILLERRIGSARWLVCYVGAGFAGSVGSVYLNHTDVGVGASGAAMGLIGALLVILALRPALFPSAERARWLYLLWACVAATGAIGLLEHRYVDNAAHGAGLVAGALLGLATLPGRGRGLGESPGGLRRAGARLAAALLVALVGASALEAWRDSGNWLGDRVVEAEGVEVTLPRWLTTRPAAEGGVVASRPPAEISVLVGATSFALARPIELVPEGPLRTFFRARSSSSEIEIGELVVEPRQPGDAALLGEIWEHGLRFVMLRDDAAFALVLVPAGADAREFYRPILEQIATSLRATR